MRSLRVTTWNVLHRVHAVNWSEEPVATFPDERARIARISATVARWLGPEPGADRASSTSVVCLQEVSGDQLASLRRAVANLGHDVHVASHCYPRLPRLRGKLGEPPRPAEAAPELDDATEHLVVLARAPAAKVHVARTFDTDPGKGLLAVEISGGAGESPVAVIDTHVTFGDRREAQLALLAEIAGRAVGAVIVLGDFNAPADVVRAGLGEPFAISSLEGQRPTRIATPYHPPRVIDHVAVARARLASAMVLDGGGLSDHNPVTADIVVG